MNRQLLRISRIVITLAVIWSSLATALAQHLTPGVVFSAGYAGIGEFNARNAFAGSAGGSFKAGRYLMGMGVIDTGTYKTPPNSRYTIDIFSNGQSRCRDTSNGQFAAGILCESGKKTVTAGMFDASALIPSAKVTVGAGYRTGVDKGVYIVGGYLAPFPNPRSQYFLRVAGGRTILEIHIGIILGIR